MCSSFNTRRKNLGFLQVKGIRLVKFLILLSLLIGLIVGGWVFMIQMPGKSYHGPLPALAEAEISLQRELQVHVEKLAGEIG